MTDKLHKDFNISVPTHFFNPVKNIFDTAGSFDFDLKSLVKYFFNEGDLNVTLSGDINQDAIDKGINDNSFADIRSVRKSLWSTLNKIGYDVDNSTYFDFLAVTNKVNSILQDGTVIDVPIFLLGTGDGDPAKITINNGTVELKGQTIFDTDHEPNVEIDVNKGSTYIIDKAFEIFGNFNINGNFDFEGEAADTKTSIQLVNKYGHTVIYKVNAADVTYNNGNKTGITFNEEKVINSTINLNNGTIVTGDKGVIFLDYKNTLNLSGDSKINGNIVLGWDQNNINVNGNFVMGDNANILCSGSIYFKNYGFSGNGIVAIYGQYWDGKQFRLSQASVEGGTLGNLYVGYDPLYDKGLGGLPATSDPKAPQNNDPLSGGNLYISMNTTLDGTVYAEGAKGAETTIYLYADTNITVGSNSKGFVINDQYSHFIALDRVNFNMLVLNEGTASLGKQDSFNVISANGGSLTTSEGEITGNDLTQYGGNLTFDRLVMNDEINILGGSLKVNNLQYSAHTLTENYTGSIDLEGGNVYNIAFVSKGNNVLDNVTVHQLSLMSGNSGKTTINGGTYETISAQGGTLDFAGNTDITAVLNFSGNTQASIEGDLKFDGSAITFASTSALTMNGGTIDFTNGTECFIGNRMIVNKTGGIFQIDGGELDFATGLEVDGKLDLKGSGSVNLFSTIAGSGNINVNSGVTLILEGSAHIAPTINLNDGGVLDIQDYNSITTSSINFANETGKLQTIIKFDNTFSDQGPYNINMAFTNVSTTDRIDFTGIDFSKVNFTKCMYHDGKMTISYADTGAVKTHTIDLTNISGKIFTDGETFTIIDDGHGGSEIDFSTGKTPAPPPSLNSSHLRSIFNGSSHNSALSNDMMKNIVDHHSSILKDFSSSLNTSKGMGELKGFGLTQTQPDHPSAFLNDNMLFRGENMGMHHDMLPQTGKLCA